MAGPRTPNFSCRMACASISSKGVGRRGKSLHDAWRALFNPTDKAIPNLPTRSSACSSASCRRTGTRRFRFSPPTPKGLATRDSSGKVLNAIALHYPWLIGGAADLAPSTKTRLMFEGAGDFEADNHGGRNMHFGIREHAMGAVVNGMALSKMRPFGAGFLIFSD